MLNPQGLAGADIEALRKVNNSAHAVILESGNDIAAVECDHDFAALGSGGGVAIGVHGSSQCSRTGTHVF